MTDLVRRTLFALVLTALTVPAAWAQTPAPEEEDPDLEVNVSQPDFNLAALPRARAAATISCFPACVIRCSPASQAPSAPGGQGPWRGPAGPDTEV